MTRIQSLAVALGLLGAAAAAHADVNIGVIVSLTGPGASLGIPAENTIKLWPAELRVALRDAIEGPREFVGTQGVFNLSATDHNGVDARSQVMVKVEGGAWSW